MSNTPAKKKKEDAEVLATVRHSTAHVMAQAVQELYPGTKLSIGPSIEEGFYYDFDYAGAFSPDDFPKIEARMQEIIAQDAPFIREEVSKEEAIRFFTERGELYKVELLEAIADEPVTLYRHDKFVDLCRGPHLPSTGGIKAFKLLSVAGAYWRGDERNKMLQRIYGTAFPTQKELDASVTLIEEAKRRDHRRLGQELDLFSIHEEAGAGLVIYHPKGALLRSILEDFERREHLTRGYQLVRGPQILKLDLWKRSGHFDNYKENMYFTEVEGQEYALKPMNCLAHMLIYKSGQRSYRDLPLRYFELGTVHRHERSGVLHGLLRVREFTQDDAHILCRPDQLLDEITRILTFVKDVMAIFAFDYELELSTRPEKSIGSDNDWEMATKALMDALTAERSDYEINEGDGAFYGPKIDIKLKDALGRRFQCATIQCDFTLPERFDLSYIGSDGEKHRPVMLHRVILGSLERFIGILIEHYGGAFPLWLAPVQAVILTVTDRTIPYGEEVYRQLLAEGMRVEHDFRNEKLGHKIREAQLQKIPYMLVIGDKEQETKQIAPRKRDGTDLKGMAVEKFLASIREERAIPEARTS
ncbi:MAG: threonine--tRNA ligase [Deltaproteobacteria bacterium RBG_16_54_18]|nr:MAG: threonine--tRNA ligase [Deltaproteobacteria bacterium RBG_16_54_18]